MKPRYKIGNLIEFNSSAMPAFGVITGVVTRDSGFYYEIADREIEVKEENVINAFNAVKKRKATKRRMKEVKSVA